jgi:hypothetical protein
MGLGVAGTAAAIGAAGSLASAGIGALSSGKQSGAIQGGQQQAHADLSPYTSAGTNALGVASDLSGANGPDAATAAMANFYTDPGYQFQLTQGLRGVDAGAAAKGMLRSGATLKAEDTFAQGLAASDFTNYYNRLFDLSKLGESAATNNASTDTSAAAAQSSIYGNTGKALGDAVTGLANNQTIQKGIGSLFNSGAGTPTNTINSLYTNPSEQAYYSAASTGSPYSFTG